MSTELTEAVYKEAPAICKFINPTPTPEIREKIAQSPKRVFISSRERENGARRELSLSDSVKSVFFYILEVCIF